MEKINLEVRLGLQIISTSLPCFSSFPVCLHLKRSVSFKYKLFYLCVHCKRCNSSSVHIFPLFLFSPLRNSANHQLIETSSHRSTKLLSNFSYNIISTFLFAPFLFVRCFARRHPSLSTSGSYSAPCEH